MSLFSRRLAALVLLLISSSSWAFDLDALSQQLGKPDAIHGQFIQEKHLRALPQPLTSKGRFVLAKAQGLLWLLETPLKQDYRITAAGIARRNPAGGWEPLPGKAAGAEQNRLFLAVLQGDSSGLQRDFEPSLSGTADDWHLVLTPRSRLLQQVFTRIEIDGGQLVQRITLRETQGDTTVLRMQGSTGNQPLNDAERADLAD